MFGNERICALSKTNAKPPALLKNGKVYSMNMKSLNTRNHNRYKELLARHENDPLKGLTDSELDWLIEYETDNPNDPEVRKNRTRMASFEIAMIETAKSEGRELFEPNLEKPSKAEKIAEQFQTLQPQFDEIFANGTNSTKLDKYIQSVFKRHRRTLSIAATILIVLSAVTGYFLHHQHQGAQREMLAEKFQPSSTYEALIGETWRSTNADEVKLPLNGSVITGDIYFRWPASPNIEWRLTILNNKLQIKFSTMLYVNEYHFKSASNKFPPGLYYWRLEAENQPQHIGKFLINPPDWLYQVQ